MNPERHSGQLQTLPLCRPRQVGVVKETPIKANPICQTGITHSPPDEKREITEEEAQRSFAGLEIEAEWMSVGDHTVDWDRDPA
jgi:hypothetical protein